MSLAIAIRLRTPGDDGLIFNSWIKSYQRSEFGQCLREMLYFSHYRPALDGVLSRSAVLVACDPEDESEVFGWIAYEPHVVHYAYTKAPFRRAKVARRLLDAAGFRGWGWAYSHETPPSRELRQRHTELRYTPYAIGGERA